MMKKMMISMMMCLMALASGAQVMTSVTIDKVYKKLTMASDSGFAYNAAYNDDGDIVAMDVYKKKPLLKGDDRLVPVCRYQYTYASDGLLSSRIKYVWRRNGWQLSGRHDYTRVDGLYTVTYSRWNRKKANYDQPLGMMAYSLLPDESIYSVAYYHRHRKDAAMELEWQTRIEYQPAGNDNYLTKE